VSVHGTNIGTTCVIASTNLVMIINCDNYLIIINIINNEVFDFHPYLHLEKQEACDGDNSITGNMTLSHDRGA